ncbi:MAG TPA: hypothetical protein PL009_15340, partial [Flavipsychrobacter sp.]|nr:hypothetical protein [Flavipsychrobacter sp.]
YLGIVHYVREEYEKGYVAFTKSLEAAYGRFSDARYYASICAANTGRQEEAKLQAAAALEDHLNGQTFTEDSSFYELYPYQVLLFRIKALVESLKK